LVPEGETAPDAPPALEPFAAAAQEAAALEPFASDSRVGAAVLAWGLHDAAGQARFFARCPSP
jgi:hypothetical protein